MVSTFLFLHFIHSFVHVRLSSFLFRCEPLSFPTISISFVTCVWRFRSFWFAIYQISPRLIFFSIVTPVLTFSFRFAKFCYYHKIASLFRQSEYHHFVLLLTLDLYFILIKYFHCFNSVRLQSKTSLTRSWRKYCLIVFFLLFLKLRCVSELLHLSWIFRWIFQEKRQPKYNIQFFNPVTFNLQSQIVLNSASTSWKNKPVS